jgi:hypothetical protein
LQTALRGKSFHQQCRKINKLFAIALSQLSKVSLQFEAREFFYPAFRKNKMSIDSPLSEKKENSLFKWRAILLSLLLSLGLVGQAFALISVDFDSGLVVGTSGNVLRVGDVAAVVNLATPEGASFEMSYSALNANPGQLLAPLSGVVGFSRSPNGPFLTSINLSPPQAVDGVDVYIKALATHENFVLRKTISSRFFDSTTLRIHPALPFEGNQTLQFADMRVDDIVPIYATQSSGLSRRYVAYRASPGVFAVQSDNVIGFGTSASGPFTNTLTVASATQGQPLFYLKAKKEQSYNFVREEMSNGTNREFNYFRVSPVTPPPPPPTPIGDSTINATWEEMAVGQIKPVNISIEGGKPNFASVMRLVDSYYNSYTNPSQVVPYIGLSFSPNGPFVSFLDVPFALDGNGNDTTVAVFVKALRKGDGARIYLDGREVKEQSALRVNNTGFGFNMYKAAEFLTNPLNDLSMGGVRDFNIWFSEGPRNISDIYVVSEKLHQQGVADGTNIAPYALFSLSPNGPFTPAVSVPVQSSAQGFGLTQKIYFKPVRPTGTSTTHGLTINTPAALVAKGQGLSVYGHSVLPAPLPYSFTVIGVAVSFGKPTMNLGVGATNTNYVQIENGEPNRVSRVRIESRSGSGLSFGSGSRLTQFPGAIELPITFDATGRGRTADFTVQGITTNSGAAATDNLIAAYVAENNSGYSATADVDIANVVELKIERYAGDSPLDTNPNAGGGLRVYPEKRTPTDTSASFDSVKVTAKLSRPLSGFKLDIRAFDVDDPSSNHADLDLNGKVGNDNRQPITAPFEAGPSEEGVSGITNAAGEFTKIFKLSHQPGDNWRFAATAIGNSGASNIYLNSAYGLNTNVNVGPDGAVVPTSIVMAASPAMASAMLTTWRRLHIERDSMGMVRNNIEQRTIMELRTDSENIWIKVNGGPLEIGRFKGGWVKIFDPTGPIEDSTRRDINAENNQTEIPVPTFGGSETVNSYGLSVGQQIQFGDDDDIHFSWIDNDNKKIDVPMPNIQWMEDSDDHGINLYAAAYIRPTYDLQGNQDDLPFFLNATHSGALSAYPTLEEFVSMTKFDNVIHRRDENFWTVYLLGAFQPPKPSDNDPDGEAYSGGLVYDGISYDGYGSAVYMETSIDLLLEGFNALSAYYDLRNVAVHETAHLLGAEHHEGGLMLHSEGPVPSMKFSEKSLRTMRGITRPTSGEN